MKRVWAIASLLFLFLQFSLYSQNKEDINVLYTETDTLSKNVKDSLLIEDLRLQIQEFKLNEILIQTQYNNNIRQSLEEDSLKKVRQRALIDSLRSLTKGVPLVVEKDTLLALYTKRGGVTPRDRVDRAEKIIMNLGKSLTLNLDSFFVFDSEYVTDIMSGDQVILTVTDQDGLWQNMSRQELAGLYLPVIANKIEQLHSEYGLMMKMKNILFSILIIAAQIGIIYLTNKLFKKLRLLIVKLMRTKLHPISFKDYEFLNVRKQAHMLIFFSNGLRIVIILLQLLITIPILFSIFPETENIAYSVFSYVWNPLKDILLSIIRYLPKLLKILVILFCFRYLNKGLKYITNEIATGKLRITGFYDDWAFPTYNILKFLLYSFMFIMIWPLLPNSDSEIFKGVSVFLGLVVSLGSTTVIGNLMAGMVLTYMRSFKIGDQIKLNGIMGVVVEKTPFVTRIRTRQNEIVTLPNSAVMSSQTVNYTMSIEKQYGVIVTVDITVGYEVDKNEVRDLLISATVGAKGIISHPKPFVMITKLDDFYCSYQINAYTRQVKTLASVYSELNERVIETFNEAGIEMMSPHFYAQRDGNAIMIPPKQTSPNIN
ncbi:MAG: mechanosensitive ion channel family protein [Tannerellaceae bacterium]|jgi:small-conductance mechanosensitive channel|nr:mechanosensitive ion channel family protein [Tannerellaceae bacterium]